MMLRVSKIVVAVGLACFATATVMVVFGWVLDDVGLVFGASAVGGFGLTVFGLGVAAVLRWQSRVLTRLVRASRSSSPSPVQSTISSDDLGEVVRVVDSRLVGFIEAVQDEINRSGR